MKFIILIGILAALTLTGCATTEKTLVTDAAVVVTDLNDFFTAINALSDNVGKTLSTAQLQSVLTSYGVKPATITSIEAVLGLVGSTASAGVTVTATLVATLDSYGANLASNAN